MLRRRETLIIKFNLCQSKLRTKKATTTIATAIQVVCESTTNPLQLEQQNSTQRGCGMYSPANAGFHAFMLATLWHYLTAIVIEFIDADTEL